MKMQNRTFRWEGNHRLNVRDDDDDDVHSQGSRLAALASGIGTAQRHGPGAGEILGGSRQTAEEGQIQAAPPRFNQIPSVTPKMASTSSRLSPARVTVLISGSGSNLQALIDASNTVKLPNVSFVRVVSDRKNAFGLERAQKSNIPTAYHGIVPYKKQYPDDSSDAQFLEARNAYDADLAKLVMADEPAIVVCAGFMRILTPSFLEPLQAAEIPIINLHPALHGDLVGAHCIERAWDEFKAGKRTKTGIMIHYVITEVDMGEPIVQQEVSIEGCETVEDLQQRIHEAEHKLIVEGTRRVIEKRR